MRMSLFQLNGNVPFVLLERPGERPPMGPLVATPRSPSAMGKAWACGGSTPLATALLAYTYDAPDKGGHSLLSYKGDISIKF